MLICFLRLNLNATSLLTLCNAAENSSKATENRPTHMTAVNRRVPRIVTLMSCVTVLTYNEASPFIISLNTRLITSLAPIIMTFLVQYYTAPAIGKLWHN